MKHETVLKIATVLAITLFFSVTTIMAQGGGGQAPSTPPGGGGGGGGGRSAGPSTPTPSPLPGSEGRQQPGQLGQQQNTPFPEMRRPIFLQGKVVMEDGAPPPDLILVERVCNGVARPEGYTDSKGRFSFELGRNNQILADASVSSADPSFGSPGFGSQQQTGGFGNNTQGMSERDLIGCELRASLPGYRSDIVQLSGRRIFDNPDVGTIILHRRGDVQGSTISVTSLDAPKDAKKAYAKGRELLGKKKPDKAQKELEKAVGIYPKYAAAWFELGRALEMQKDDEGARKAYSEALSSDAKFVNPYLQLAGIAAKEQKWQEVADTTGRVVQLDPTSFPGAYYYNAIANYNMKNLDAAEKSAREALKLDGQHRFPKIDHLLGVILAQKGEFPEAAEHMKGYLKLVPDGSSDADLVKKQLTELERLMGTAAQNQQK